MLFSCLQFHPKRCILLLAVFWLTGIALQACGQEFIIADQRHKAVIPFRLIRNMVIVKLQINQHGPYNFILDTGCGVTVITDPLLIDSLNLKYRKKLKIIGLGEGDDLSAWMVSSLNISLKGVEGKNMSAAFLTKDVLEISAFAGIPVHGLIGYDFFNSFPVKINFADSTITVFSTPKLPSGFKKSQSLPITISENKPYINASINYNSTMVLPAKLLVDLGAGHPLSLESGWNNSNAMPEKFIAAANLGIGLSGPINGYMSRVESMDVGQFKFRQVIAAFPDSCSTMDKVFAVKRDGSIGVDLLKKFVLLFDYQQGKLYLKPNNKFKEPFEHDMSGMEFYTAGQDFKRIIVCRVEPGSAADRLGITKDDEILAINFKDVSKMTLQEVDEIMRSKNDQTILLDVMHQNAFARLLLTLKRRI